MTFTLLLLRHAETEPKQPGQSDFDRELLPKGINQSMRLGEYLAKLNIKPDQIVSSPAHRAKKTCSLVIKPLGIVENEVQFDKLIYSADIEELLDIIRNTEDKYNTLMMVGHNPTISSLANYLVFDFKVGLNTCDLVWIELETPDWSSIDQHCGSLKTFIQNSSLQ